jgi:hypothetical protein
LQAAAKRENTRMGWPAVTVRVLRGFSLTLKSEFESHRPDHFFNPLLVSFRKRFSSCRRPLTLLRL